MTNYTVTAATNATPIVLTTSANHNVVAGDLVIVRGVTGNTAANGTFTAQAVTANTITLSESAGNAAYVSGGAVVKSAFAVEVMSPDGLRVRGIEADLDASPVPTLGPLRQRQRALRAALCGPVDPCPEQFRVH